MMQTSSYVAAESVELGAVMKIPLTPKSSPEKKLGQHEKQQQQGHI